MESHPQVFYETIVARTIPWALLMVISVIGLFVPIEHSSFKITVYVVLALSIVLTIRGVFAKRPVVELSMDGIVMRGVRPGMWKLFQLWIVERIEDANISLIRVGYIRDKRLGGLFSYPPGEPSKGAVFQMFLWIKYRKEGVERDIYYPHLKNVANYPQLIKLLEDHYGPKLEKSL
jgi:hypothetical protein